MFILSIRRNDFYQLNYLRILYKRLHSIQSLKIYINRGLKSVKNGSNNGYESKNILGKDEIKKKSSRSNFLKTSSNLNKKVEIKQKFKEKPGKNREKHFKKQSRSKDASFLESKSPNFGNNNSKNYYTKEDTKLKRSPVIRNKNIKSLSNLKHSGTNKNVISNKSSSNVEKSNTVEPDKISTNTSSIPSIYLPNAITISNLSQLLKLKLERLSIKMKELGFKNTNHDFRNLFKIINGMINSI